MFEQQRRIEYSQLAPDRTVGAPDVLRMLQDIAVAHTTSCGYSLEKLTEMKRAWLLLSTHIRFDRPIIQSSDITITTWTYDFARAFGPRAFSIFDAKSGEKFASAATLWTFVDIDSGRPKEIPEEILLLYGNDPPSDIPYIRRAPNYEAEEHFADFRVLKRDLDSNHHVNNVKYVEYAMEALPDDCAISEIEVYYKRPAYLGEVISLFWQETENGRYQMEIKNQSGEVCTYVQFTTKRKADTL